MSLPLDHAAIAALVPHAGAMCLLDSVVDWDAQRIHCRARLHALHDHPLRGAGGLRALHLCEYGAQAMAVHGGLLAREAGKRAAPGLLAALRAVRLHASHVDALAGWLDITAERLLETDDGWVYAFHASHQGRPLAEGRATVLHLAEEPMP